jgi:hypothetical protein
MYFKKQKTYTIKYRKYNIFKGAIVFVESIKDKIN